MANQTNQRVIRADRGTNLSCKGWEQEAALRMLMNNLDPEVAEIRMSLLYMVELEKRRETGNHLMRLSLPLRI